MTKTCLARRNVAGECEAARAKLVKGPIAIMVMVLVGFSSRIRRISRWEGRFEGVNREVDEGSELCVADKTELVTRLLGGGRSKRVFQVSSGQE